MLSLLFDGLCLIRCIRRLENDSPRKDFLSTVIKNFHEGAVSKEEMTAHVSTLT